MQTVHRSVLIQYNEFLLNNIYDVDGVVETLLSRRVLDANMKERIKAKQTRLERKTELLAMLPCMGENSFPEFCEALEHNGFAHAATSLREAAAMSEMNAASSERVRLAELQLEQQRVQLEHMTAQIQLQYVQLEIERERTIRVELKNQATRDQNEAILKRQQQRFDHQKAMKELQLRSERQQLRVQLHRNEVDAMRIEHEEENRSFNENMKVTTYGVLGGACGGIGLTGAGYLAGTAATGALIGAGVVAVPAAVVLGGVKMYKWATACPVRNAADVANVARDVFDN